MNAVDDSGWDDLIQTLNRSKELLYKTWKLNETMVANGLAMIHNETSLTCTILIAYYMNPIMEFPSRKGFADVVYLLKQGVEYPALVIELKWNKSTKGTIQQIKDRQYFS